MATHLLDTSVYCQPLRPRPVPPVIQRWQTIGEADLVTSVIADAELKFGLMLKNSPKLWSAYDRLLRGRLAVLPVEQDVGEAFADLKAHQQKKGQRIPDLDLLVAATARVHGLIVATLNPRHFVCLEGVRVEDWSQPA